MNHINSCLKLCAVKVKMGNIFTDIRSNKQQMGILSGLLIRFSFRDILRDWSR